MKNKSLITLIVALFLVLPSVLAQVRIQLGEPYTNIRDVSKIEFKSHPDYYPICSLDETILPVLITNQNKFWDTFQFQVNKDYVSLPVKAAVLESGKSAILPLKIKPPLGLEENATLVLDVITKREGLKRSVIIKTNIEECYLFDLKFDKEKDEICGCDKKIYTLLLNNTGDYTDTFVLTLEMPEWINSDLVNDTIILENGQQKEVIFDVNVSCDEKGIFDVNAKALSEKTKAIKEANLELDVLAQKECYNTVISANDVTIDYFGKNIPLVIRNKGAKDAKYTLSIEGIDWYTLSQNTFTIRKNEEKTVNLALHPGENVLVGKYSVDIKAESDSQEFKKLITIKLKSEMGIFEKIKFYLNYYKYYIGVGVILLIVVLLVLILIKKMRGVSERFEEEEKVVEEEKKLELKKDVEELKKTKEGTKWLSPIVFYVISIGLVSLLIYSTFKYKTYYEKILNILSELFAKYVVPYGSYLKYVIAGICFLIVLVLIVDLFRKKQKKTESKGLKEVKKQRVKVNKKLIKKRKLNFFVYIIIILLFLGIAGYVLYKFFGEKIPLDKFAFLVAFIKSYYVYFIMGIVSLFLLILIIYFVQKRKKKVVRKVGGKSSKKIKKRINWKLIKNVIIIVVGLIILSGIIYSFVYYNVVEYIKSFLIVYSPYFLMGAGILVILILILHFHSKKIS